MKSLIIIRHAKSSWETIMDDFNRPLNERGKHDAPEMARRLLSDKIEIDVFVSSPAKRAKKTAQIFMDEFKRGREELILVPELYNAPASAFYQVAMGLDAICDTAAIFAHNPGITQFANSLTGSRIDEMPTCGVFGIKIHADNWKNFQTAEKEFWFFDYPKLKAD